MVLDKVASLSWSGTLRSPERFRSSAVDDLAFFGLVRPRLQLG
jgi:hypothetical protein